MRKFLKNIFPIYIIQLVRKLNYDKQKSPFSNKNLVTVFEEIYQKNYWKSKESISGLGSESIQTKVIIEKINYIIQKCDIKSIADIPCGDFNWMKNVNLENVFYYGGDIVSDLIQTNKSIYETENITFKHIDITKDEIPKSDLIIVRDCFVHLSYEAIFAALNNIKKSKSTYLLSTSFLNHKNNIDLVSGDWMPINLQMPPFNLPSPVFHFLEDCTEDPEFDDKSLCLWKIEDI